MKKFILKTIFNLAIWLLSKMDQEEISKVFNEVLSKSGDKHTTNELENIFSFKGINVLINLMAVYPEFDKPYDTEFVETVRKAIDIRKQKQLAEQELEEEE